MIACQKGFIELVSDILEKGAWVNHADNDQRTALHYAIDNKAENLDVVHLLIEKEANVNRETTSDGYTPLIIAVNRGHKNIAKILIDLGVKLDAIECNNQNTALHIACMNGEEEIVKMLATEQTFHTVFNKLNAQKQIPLDISQQKVVDETSNLVHGVQGK